MLAGGVQPNDQIVEVNGIKTPNWDKVLSAIETVKPGEMLTLGVMRAGSEQKVEVKVPEKPSPFQLSAIRTGLRCSTKSPLDFRPKRRDYTLEIWSPPSTANRLLPGIN